ncbi:MAG: hypothetical protein IIY12_03895, partial [Clostridia bacterium]|nr:hypothetical protein [Clostridia bacterium]
MAELYFNVEINNDYFRSRIVVDRNMRNARPEGERTEGNTVYRDYCLPAQEGESVLSVTVREEKVTDKISRVSTAVTAHGEEPILLNGVSSL